MGFVEAPAPDLERARSLNSPRVLLPNPQSVCSLVLPGLKLPALLGLGLHLGLDVVGVIADPVRFALAQG